MSKTIKDRISQIETAGIAVPHCNTYVKKPILGLSIFDWELIIVLRELTIGLRTLILFEGGRRKSTLDLRELTPVLTLTRFCCHVKYFKEFGVNLDFLR